MKFFIANSEILDFNHDNAAKNVSRSFLIEHKALLKEEKLESCFRYSSNLMRKDYEKIQTLHQNLI